MTDFLDVDHVDSATARFIVRRLMRLWNDEAPTTPLPEALLDRLLDLPDDPSIDPQVEYRFRRLAERWRLETAHESSLTRKALHPAYQQIIGLGAAVLPLLLREMAERPDHWHSALVAITGTNPVSPEDAGRIKRMAASWSRWARENGFLH